MAFQMKGCEEVSSASPEKNENQGNLPDQQETILLQRAPQLLE